MSGIHPLLKNRKSCRKFLSKPISMQDIYTILAGAQWAPSGKNGQPWRFVIVKESKTKNKIANCSIYKEWMTEADIFIVVYLDKKNSYNYKKDLQAIGAAIENICLQASAMDIGTCWIGEILEKEADINKIINVPKTYELMAVICVGYAKEDNFRANRMELNKLIYKEIY
ncbi:MAG: nitroreductase family protein [Lachnoclostridium sp.]|nr:nitroreductase family protein [Lachnospira sp.]MCM1248924.1 nitroreductase family protein [Lachnoclostridium sp.]